jgi:hypothetical protein
MDRVVGARARTHARTHARMSLIGKKLGTRRAADTPRAMRQSKRRDARERLRGTSSSRQIGAATRFRDTLGNEYSVDRIERSSWRLLVRPQRPLRERRRHGRSDRASGALRTALRRALSVRRGTLLRLIDVAVQRVLVASVIDVGRSPATGTGVVVVRTPRDAGDAADPAQFVADPIVA